jgi:hypothetical protein
VRRGAPSALERPAALILTALANLRAYSFIAGTGAHEESLGRSLIIAKIIEGSLMTCRIEMSAWEHGVVEKREKCAR